MILESKVYVLMYSIHIIAKRTFELLWRKICECLLHVTTILTACAFDKRFLMLLCTRVCLDGYAYSIKRHEADIFSTFTSLLTQNTDKDVLPFSQGLKKAWNYFVNINAFVFKKQIKYGLVFFLSEIRLDALHLVYWKERSSPHTSRVISRLFVVLKCPYVTYFKHMSTEKCILVWSSASMIQNLIVGLFVHEMSYFPCAKRLPFKLAVAETNRWNASKSSLLFFFFFFFLNFSFC